MQALKELCEEHNVEIEIMEDGWVSVRDSYGKSLDVFYFVDNTEEEQ
jgi:hypothetical protein